VFVQLIQVSVNNLETAIADTAIIISSSPLSDVLTEGSDVAAPKKKRKYTKISITPPRLLRKKRPKSTRLVVESDSENENN
jgi:hypothetical protein